MSLYVVTLERTMVVEAESERDAERIAEREEREECGVSDPDFVDARPATERNIPREWLNSIPYGSDLSLTVQDILDRQEPPPFIDTLTPDIFKVSA